MHIQENIQVHHVSNLKHFRNTKITNVRGNEFKNKKTITGLFFVLRKLLC